MNIPPATGLNPVATLYERKGPMIRVLLAILLLALLAALWLRRAFKASGGDGEPTGEEPSQVDRAQRDSGDAGSG